MTGNSSRSAHAYEATAARTVRIPADIDRPDRLLAGLTARQLAWLITGTTVGYLLLVVLRRWAPLPVAAALSAPPLLVAALIAFAGRDGLPGDRLLAAAVAHWRRPSLLAPLPADAPLAPPWARALLDTHSPQMAVSSWGLPVQAITDGSGQAGTHRGEPADEHVVAADVSAAGLAGVLDLGSDGTAVIAAASCVNFTLRSPAEQDALTAAYGRFLNSAGGRLQILLRSHPLEVDEICARLQTAAETLPHPALQAAAVEHAAFLRQLAARPAVRHRQALLVLHDPRRPPMAGPLLTGRLADAGRGLARAGITIRPLTASQAANLLAECADPTTRIHPAGDIEPGSPPQAQDTVVSGLAGLGFRTDAGWDDSWDNDSTVFAGAAFAGGRS